jgi:hypothetical protein
LLGQALAEPGADAGHDAFPAGRHPVAEGLHIGGILSRLM